MRNKNCPFCGEDTIKKGTLRNGAEVYYCENAECELCGVDITKQWLEKHRQLRREVKLLRRKIQAAENYLEYLYVNGTQDVKLIANTCLEEIAKAGREEQE